MKKQFVSALIGILALGFVFPSHATIILPVTSLNTNGDFDPAGSLFGLSFTADATSATFTFANNDTLYGSTITTLYFGNAPDFSNAFDIGSVSFASTGGTVNYTCCRSNGLPGSLGFTVDEKAKATAPSPTNGINTGESLSIKFNFLGGSLTESAIFNLFNTDKFNIAFHLQTINGAYSEYYGSCVGPCNPTKVPEPGTLSLLGAGLLGLGLLRRRRATA